MKKFKAFDAFNYLFFVIISFISVFPIYLIAANAFSTEADIVNIGYATYPLHFTFDAFKYLLRAPGQILKSVWASIVYAAFGGFFGVFIQAMLGYVLTREEYCLKRFVKIILVITMFFSPGLIPQYMVNTQIFHLENTWLVYILLGCTNSFNVFIFRTFFRQIPNSLIESAEIDGATPFKVLTTIILPLSKPILATQFFMILSARWKDFSTTLYYITDPNKYTLEFYIQSLLKDASSLASSYKMMGLDTSNLPLETMKFAVVFFALIPMVIIFPLFQKQLAKGAMVGAVKG